MNFYNNTTLHEDITPLFAVDDLTSPFDLPSVDFSVCSNKTKQLDYPASPSFPCQDDMFGNMGDIAFPVHFKPEEPYDFSEFQSAQTLFCDPISLFSESPPDMCTNEIPSGELATSDKNDSYFQIGENHQVPVASQDIPLIPSIPSNLASGKKSEKKCKNSETISFYCTRTTCRRINRKCGQMTYQRLKKWCQERSNIKNTLQGNCYYDF